VGQFSIGDLGQFCTGGNNPEQSEWKTPVGTNLRVGYQKGKLNRPPKILDAWSSIPNAF
jgi:hypothetical protein